MARSPRTERALAVRAWLLASLLAALPGAAQANDLTFARRGQPVKTLSLEALRASVEASRVHVLEPYEEGEATFQALPLPAVLDRAYGPAWREEEELLFTCLDGYQPGVPVSRVLAHEAWLAFDRVDAPAFAIRKRESGQVRNVDLGPYYLIWENVDDPVILQEMDYGWPYQLVGVDLIRSADRFPKLAPPAGASEKVRAGFVEYRVHCAKCHELNGEGGNIGPELNAPGSPLADREEAWLRTWIADPQKIRPNTRMESLNPKLPDREKVVDEIVAYLHAMVGKPSGAGD